MKHNIIAAVLVSLPIIAATPSHAAIVLTCHWQGATFYVDRSSDIYQIKFNDTPWVEANPVVEDGYFKIGVKTDSGAHVLVVYNPTTEGGAFSVKAAGGKSIEGVAFCK